MPPVTREGEAPSSCTKALSEKERKSPALRRIILDSPWLDQHIDSFRPRFAQRCPSNDREAIAQHLAVDRLSPQPAEVDERVTDSFHLRFILEPAAAIAGSILGEQLEATFAPRKATDLGTTIGDLQVKQRLGGRCYLIAEDKRGRVFDAHRHMLLQLVDKAFPWPVEGGTASDAVRIWMQASLSIDGITPADVFLVVDRDP